MEAETDRDEDPVPGLEDMDDPLAGVPKSYPLAGVPKGYRKESVIVLFGGLFPVTYDQYIANRRANVRGTANPSIMNNPFWISQVGPNGIDAMTARRFWELAVDPPADSLIPVWSFHRMGTTCTKLPDGRLIYIGGQQEDRGNADFCIYNDVIVYAAPQKTDPPPLLTPDCITIYGYPDYVFPPTGFHTSTYYADSTTGKEMIFIIGGVGYSKDRTEVHILDLSDFNIHIVKTFGEGPIGPTSLHTARLLIEDNWPEDEQPVIRIKTKGRLEDFRKIVAGDETLARAKKEEALVAKKNGEFDTKKKSKVFTLRIKDMKWR